MNHYEELGVSRSASISEIRQAYKTLVRVLHPDQQQDENLRRLSELQLRRLNRILEVLTDPERRREYDLSLDRLLPVPRHAEIVPPRKSPFSFSDLRAVPLRSHLNTGVFVWLLIATIAIGSGVVWIRSPEPVSQAARTVPKPMTERPESKETKPVTPPFEAPSQTITAPPKTSEHRTSEVALQRREVAKPTPVTQTTVPQTDQRLAAVIRPETSKTAPSAAVPDNPSATPVHAANPQPAEDPVAPLKTPASSISGKWLYVPKPDENKNNLYPAEYIEMRISSRAGLLHGRYRGKYRVNDRAISSEINFQFEGKQGDAVSLLPWSSSNGSKGELRVRRLSDESIEVNWITTSFGNSNTLASGTAVLYRSDPP